MQTARLPLLETDQCIAPHVYGPNRIGGGMFCAGFLEGGIDTCQVIFQIQTHENLGNLHNFHQEYCVC